MNRCLGKLMLLTAAVLGVTAVASPARAGMIPTNVSVVSDGGNFRWTYAVVVTTNVRVDPGDSFTIYDFAGLVDGTIVMPVGWSASQSLAGPSRPGTNPTDNPGLMNLTFTYEGEEPIVGQQGLGNFWALSTFDERTTGDFTSTTHRELDGLAETNITSTDVPLFEQIVHDSPEPATLALLGLGLPVVGLARLIRKRKIK